MKTILPDKWYNVVKWISIIGMPALALFVGVLGSTWGWADTDKIVKTINATGLFIGALIGVSTVQYNSQKNGDPK